jgi:MoxR-like ATPase
MRYDFMADDILIASRNDLEAALTSMARAHCMVFIAGLPGVGKSLFIRELARVAHGMGRNVYLLQVHADDAEPLLAGAKTLFTGNLRGEVVRQLLAA